MEKTIVIDGKTVSFKTTGATPLRYKQQFRKDFFADLVSLVGKLDSKKEINEIEADDITNINFEIFYNIAWTFAKTADKSIAAPLDWLDTFDEFPILEILPELQDMLMATVQTKKK
ncbi:hypothetical protein D3C74_137590 [compost metagenome]